MSTTESESDYIINYITGYVIEDAEQCLNSSKSKQCECSQDGHEDYPGLPYAEEPLATEEWTRNYQTSEDARREFEEKLVKRFNKSIGIKDW